MPDLALYSLARVGTLCSESKLALYSLARVDVFISGSPLPVVLTSLAIVTPSGRLSTHTKVLFRVQTNVVCQFSERIGEFTEK